MLLNYKMLLKWVCVSLLLLSGWAQADKIHDPTRPKINMQALTEGNHAADKQADYALQGVVNKQGIKMAIIAGQLHQLGDEVDGYKIAKINNNNIVLIKSGSQKRLYVYEK